MRKRHPTATVFDEEDEASSGPPYQVFTTEKTVKTFDVYLSAHADEPSVYDPLCHLLRQASEEDSVRLFLNTPGGSLFAGAALIHAMRESAATITTILHPAAYSMGALIFLCGDEVEVPPTAHLMFHHYSDELKGKGNELLAEVTASVTWYERLLRDTSTGFLTETEIRDLLQGKDLWLHSDEILARMENLRRADA